MFTRFRSPNIVAAASSRLGENSVALQLPLISFQYSHHVDRDIGVSVVDRFTHRTLQTLERVKRDDAQPKTLKDLFDTYEYRDLYSHASFRTDLFRRDIASVCLPFVFDRLDSSLARLP